MGETELSILFMSLYIKQLYERQYFPNAKYTIPLYTKNKRLYRNKTNLKALCSPFLIHSLNC
jgi:hypothetical protein